ncbi:hypothetical protein [Rarobacter incanus]|uniref:Ig-like domain-containing protein n=1 Tax=Rarobacter incanus TaxID=153494 RepID=A0A542SRL8_9MICO|nr:hypothetical protein [Rarobacter incanus]TQK77259.1 hypothetical protein FB389_1978 [Rarobacter incanus]
MTRIRLKSAAIALSLILAGGTVALGAPAAQAAGVGAFTSVTFPQAPKTVTLPADGSKYVPLNITFNGPAAQSDYSDSNGDGIKYASYFITADVSVVSSPDKSYVPKLYVSSRTSHTAGPGTDKFWQLELNQYKSPGVYRVDVNVKLSATTTANEDITVTKRGTLTITVNGSKSWAKQKTSFSSYLYVRKGRADTYLYTPEAYAGSKVRVYVKSKGKKKYKKIKKAFKLKRQSSSARAKLKLSGVKLPAKVKVKVAKSKHGPAYSYTAKYKKR